MVGVNTIDGGNVNNVGVLLVHPGILWQMLLPKLGGVMCTVPFMGAVVWELMVFCLVMFFYQIMVVVFY